MTAPSSRDRDHVQRFLTQKGSRLLELLGERPAPGDWILHSHGAVRAVVGDAEALFERRIVVLVSEGGQPDDVFMAWGEARFRRLGQYIERCDLGRLVRCLPQKLSVTGVFMLRRGADPGAPGTELPSPELVLKLLRTFGGDLQHYLTLMGDDELRYVSALQLHRLPRGQKAAEYRLGLDAISTVIGLRAEGLPLGAVTLMRGVVAELAERYEARRDEVKVGGSLLHPIRLRSIRREAQALAALVNSLDVLVGKIDRGTDLKQLRGWLKTLRVEAPSASILWWLLVGGAALAAGALAWR